MAVGTDFGLAYLAVKKTNDGFAWNDVDSWWDWKSSFFDDEPTALHYSKIHTPN